MTATIKFTCITGTIFAKLRLFFYQVSFIIHTVFPLLLETLYAGRVQLFAKALDLHARCVLARRPQNSALGVHPSWGQEDESRRLLNRCFNFFNVCRYRSELILAPLQEFP
jgi:hypothetical protein